MGATGSDVIQCLAVGTLAAFNFDCRRGMPHLRARGPGRTVPGHAQLWGPPGLQGAQPPLAREASTRGVHRMHGGMRDQVQ
jgi:hypothetical protein